MYCNKKPITKTGNEIATRLMTSDPLSNQPPLRRPLTMPAPIPMTSSKMIATVVSLAVVG